MIGFSLIIEKNQINKQIAYKFNQNDDVFFEGSSVLNLYQDPKQQYLNDDQHVLYNIGTIIYQNKTSDDALSLILDDLKKGIEESTILSNTHGQFCLVVYQNGQVIIATDKLGSFPIYKYESENAIIISNILRMTLSSSNVSINSQALAEYLSFDYVLDGTIFNEISLLKGGHYYKYSEKRQEHEYFNYLNSLHFGKYSRIEEVTEMSSQIMLENFKFLHTIDTIFCDLTGGFDTRTIIALVNKMGIKFTCGICGEQNLNETNIAKEVADKLDFTFLSNIKIDDYNCFSENLNLNYALSGGIPIPYHSTELLNYYKTIKQNFDIHISGFAGSQLFDNWLPRLTLISKKLSFDALMYKLFRFADIFNNEKINEHYYRKTINHKIKAICNSIGSERFDHVSNYLTLSTFSKYYHGSLIGAHNTILPIYVPFLEADFARLMIETSTKLKNNRNIQRHILNSINEPISKILTTHGYDASISGSNISKLNKFIKNINNIQRRCMYSIPFLMKFNDFTSTIKKKPVSSASLAEKQRAFWLDQIDRDWSDEMIIYDIVNRDKLNTNLQNNTQSSKMRAKILYVNKLMKEFNPKVI